MNGSYDSDGYQQLACAVIETAVNDWRYANLQLRRPSGMTPANAKMKHSCERFFLSSWFEELSGFDGSSFLRRLKES